MDCKTNEDIGVLIQLKTGILLDRIWNIKPLVSKCRENVFNQTSFWVLLFAPWIRSIARSPVSKNYFTNNLPSTRGSSKRPLSGRFRHQQPVCIFLSALCSIRHTERICDMVNLNDIWWRMGAMKLLLMRLSRASDYLRPSYRKTFSGIFPQYERSDCRAV